jgi:hypothetical protein
MLVSWVGVMVGVKVSLEGPFVPHAARQALACLAVARRIKGAIAHIVASSNPISML